MKLNYLPIASALLLLTGCCQTSYPCCNDVVDETYVHRYGVPLSRTDWASRGRDGQVVSTLTSGVVMNRSYDRGVLHGETTYTFPHREVIEKRELYDQGRLIRETWNYPNGIPCKQVSYTSPSQRIILQWYDGGIPQCQELYEGDRLINGEYWTLGGLTESVVHEGQGVRVARDSHGELESRDDVNEGNIISRTTYHANGAPEAVTPYANGKIEGQRKTYHPSGEPNTIEEWTQNEQHGVTVVYQNGEKYAEVPYSKGEKHGIEKRYRDAEAVVEEVSWVYGQQHGPCRSYVGGVPRTDWYFQGQKVNKATYDALKNQ